MDYAASMTPLLLAIVGHSGAGKTTLIERLLPVLSANGMKVATIKHSHHALVMDVAGSDSWRHKNAGAKASMLVTSSGMQLVADTVIQYAPEKLAQCYLSDMDLVLAEGFSYSHAAKIEVLRAACSTIARCAVNDGLIAMVTDVEGCNPQLPYFALDDIDQIAGFIMEWKNTQGRSHDQ